MKPKAIRNKLTGKFMQVNGLPKFGWVETFTGEFNPEIYEEIEVLTAPSKEELEPSSSAYIDKLNFLFFNLTSEQKAALSLLKLRLDEVLSKNDPGAAKIILQNENFPNGYPRIKQQMINIFTEV